MRLPGYKSTPNKERVREEDTKFAINEFKRKNRALSYLGMPSGEIRDLLAWGTYFERATAVEIDEKQRTEMVLNLMKFDPCKTEILFGDVESILINGKDDYGNRLSYPYDIIFLDFFGVILYSGLTRIKAIKNIFKNQNNIEFVLFLTLNIKDKKYCGEMIRSELRDIKKELLSLYENQVKIVDKIKSVFQWYETVKFSEMYVQKVFVPYLVKIFAESFGYKSHAYSPIFYMGYKNNPMMHFSFKLEPKANHIVKAYSTQNTIDIINLGLKEASKGRVFLKDKQAPKIGL